MTTTTTHLPITTGARDDALVVKASVPVPADQRERGSALLETIIALVLLLAVLVPVATVVRTTFTVGAGARLRVEAANLAAGQIDQLGNTAGGITLNGSVASTTVQGVTYTIHQEVTPTSFVGTGSYCTQHGAIDVLRVTETVTWRSGGVSQSFVQSSLITPAVGDYSANHGAVAVQVNDSANQVVSNVTATIADKSGATQSAMTGADGCAVFANLTPGAYTVAITAAGYVNDQELAAPTRSLQVTAGAATTVPFSFDIAGSIQANFTVACPPAAPPAPAVPCGAATGLPLAFGNTSLTPVGWLSTPYVAGSGSPVVSGPLYPYPSGYGLWAGSCMPADPTGVNSSGQPLYSNAAPPVPVAIRKGLSTTASVALTPVSVVTSSLSGALSGVTLTATPTGSGCTGVYGMVTTAAGGASVTGLALGAYTITATQKKLSATTSISVRPDGVYNVLGVKLTGPIVMVLV